MTIRSSSVPRSILWNILFGVELLPTECACGRLPSVYSVREKAMSRSRKDVYVDKTTVGDGEVTALSVHFGFGASGIVRTTNLGRYKTRKISEVYVSADGKETYPDF